MVKQISKNSMLKMSEDIANYVEKNYALPTKLTYDGTNFYILEYTYAMSYGVYHLKSNFTIPNFSWADSPSGNNVNINILQADYMDMAKRVFNFIEKNKKCPNWVLVKGMKIDVRLYIYVMAKVIRFYKNKGHLPSNVQIDYRAFTKPAPKPKTYSEEILDYFISKFGNVTTIDGALNKIKGKGYGYYYDDQYTNKNSIDRMRNGHGVNCTDSCHVFWHIGKALGYDVRAIHVRCRGGDGHIRLQFNKNNNGWFNRDPAAVLDGECVECIWCSNGTYLSTNPQWFLNNVNR